MKGLDIHTDRKGFTFAQIDLMKRSFQLVFQLDEKHPSPLTEDEKKLQNSCSDYLKSLKAIDDEGCVLFDNLPEPFVKWIGKYC